MATTSLKISCACGNITGTLDVPDSLLPRPLSFCHCTTCRHATGQLCLSSIEVPPWSGLSSLSLARQPAANRTSDHLKRYFCGQCGASIYNHTSDGNDYIASGVVDRTEGILAFKMYQFLADTKDGGFSKWLNGLSWAGSAEQSEIWKPTAEVNQPKIKDGNEVLRCYCQCRGVQFTITRPNKDSSNVFSPMPDVLAPGHLQSTQANPSSIWWLRANGTKFLAGICACNSCRLSAGYDIQAWVFVPKTNVRQLDGNEVDYKMGTLKRYSHSKGAYRDFCSTCGATVFWHCDERPGILDVSAGLLDAEEGARAEDWFEWATEKVSFEECAQNKALVASVSRGLREWGANRT